MIKLTRIEINGFKADRRRIEIDLSTENITIIYGENGVGKTTLLKILFSIFSHNEELLKNEKVKEIILYYNDSSSKSNKSTSVKIERIEETKELTVIDDNHKQKKILVSTNVRYDWKAYENSPLFNCKSISIGVERGIPNPSSQIDPESIIRFFRNPRYRNTLKENQENIESLSFRLADFVNHDNLIYRRRSLARRNELRLDEKNIQFNTINIDEIEFLVIERYKMARFVTNRKIQSALFDTLALAIDQKNTLAKTIPSDIIPKLMDNKKRLLEALSDTEDNRLKNRLLQIVDDINENNFEDICASNNLIASLLIKMTEELENEKQFISSINMVIELFNNFVQKGKSLVIEENKLTVKVGNRKHSLSDLSSGERHLLTFLSLIIIDANERDFLIIDEPELSLNIDWQRKLLPLLNHLAPLTQIIVASHSPSLAKSNSNYLSKLILHEVE